MPDESADMTRLQQAYYEGFLIALVICWSPANLLAYLAPAICLGWVVWRAGFPRTLIRNLGFIAGLLTIWICLAGLLDDRFVLPNALLATITYSAFYLPLAVPSRQLANRELSVKIGRVLVLVVLLEGALGILQAAHGFSVTHTLDITNGDFVEGTIHPWLASEHSFSNPMFATNMSFSLILLLVWARHARKGLALAAVGVGVLSLVLASVLHVLLFLLGAAAVAALLVLPWALTRRSLGVLWLSASFAATAVLAMLLILPTNLSTIRSYASASMTGDNPKVEVTRRLVVDGWRTAPERFFFGYGPGQAVSRSALIATGQYFGGFLNPRSLPLLEPVTTEPLDRLVMDLWVDVATRSYSVGSTRVPFSSWLAIFSEAGAIGFLALGVGVVALLARALLRGQRSRRPEVAWALGTGLLLLFALGVQEHYWEVPQAIFVGALGLKLLDAQLTVSPPTASEGGSAA